MELGHQIIAFMKELNGKSAAYASSKAGLIQLTKWLSTTLASSIRVNAISPGVY